MKRALLILLAALLAAAACTKQQVQNYYDKQQSAIDKFVTAAKGVKTIYKGNAVLFATNYKTLAESSRWTLSDESTFALTTLKLDETPLLEGLRDGLAGVRGGEECYIIFLGKYGFGNHASGTIPAKATLVYHIWVDSIQNE